MVMMIMTKKGIGRGKTSGGMEFDLSLFSFVRGGHFVLAMKWGKGTLVKDLMGHHHGEEPEGDGFTEAEGIVGVQLGSGISSRQRARGGERGVGICS